MFFFFLLLAHIQAVAVPIFFGIKSINKFREVKSKLIVPFGFIFFGLASLFEMIDHSKTSWIYTDHSSLFNWLFYTFLSLGLTFLTISAIENSIVVKLNLFICLCSIFSYLLFDKTIALFFQVIISTSLIINWQRKFKDWLLIAYPIFGIIFTTFFGIKLSSTGNQLWHIFIGPSGSISLSIFYLILKRSNEKFFKISK